MTTALSVVLVKMPYVNAMENGIFARDSKSSLGRLLSREDESGIAKIVLVLLLNRSRS